MKALITGAGGFLGRAVARVLVDAGYSIIGLGHGVDKDGAFSAVAGSFWHDVDIDLNALVTYADEPDVIVHCAGSASVAFSVAHPLEDFHRTVVSTMAVLEYMRLHSPSTTLIYPSSAAVYGNAERLPIEIEDALRPASPYGIHKKMAEEACQSYAGAYGLRVAMIRFFSLYGEGLKKQLLWDACQKIGRNDPTFFGTGEELRDWLHVDDAARLVLVAVPHASSECPVVNGGSGEGTPVRQILSTLFREVGTDVAPEFTGVVRRGDPLGYQAATGSALSWGWKPTITWQEGLRRYAAWYRSYAS